VPFNVSSFCYDRKLFANPNQIDSFFEADVDAQVFGAEVVPSPLECADISSKLNAVVQLRRASAPYRPSSPVAYEPGASASASESLSFINPMELLRDIRSSFNF
jgi:hypothetical protein